MLGRGLKIFQLEMFTSSPRTLHRLPSIQIWLYEANFYFKVNFDLKAYGFLEFLVARASSKVQGDLGGDRG